MMIGYFYSKCGDSPDYGVHVLLRQHWKSSKGFLWGEFPSESRWIVPGTVSIDD